MRLQTTGRLAALALLVLPAAAGSLSLAGCDAADPSGGSATGTIRSATGALTAELPGSASRGRVVHRVTVGTADGAPGEDSNFSSHASQFAGGTVRGTHTDVVVTENGNVNIHGTVDCLRVDGNTAYYGGEITTGLFAGRRFVTAVRDNGRSQQDAPDEISATRLIRTVTCLSPDFTPRFFPAEQGQVVVE